MFEIKKLVGAFPYESVLFGSGDHRDGKPRVLRTNEMPWSFLGAMKEHLDEEATLIVPRWHPDNKTTFLWLGNDHSWHAMSFYDYTARHISWGVLWDLEVPANFWRGVPLVQEAIRPAVECWIAERRIRRNADTARTFPR